MKHHSICCDASQHLGNSVLGSKKRDYLLSKERI